MKIKSKVVVMQPIHEKGLRLLLDNVEEVVCPSREQLKNPAAFLDDKVEGIITRSFKIPRELLEMSPNLKVIARHGVGTEHIDVQTATERGVAVVNTPNASTVSVAEHALMMMLCLAKNIFLANRAMREGNYYIKDRYLAYELKGKTVGIIGFGRIGAEIARKCLHGFNMKVLVLNHNLDKEAYAKEGINVVDDLDKLLEESDFVSLHVPLTPKTKNLISEAQLKRMKKTAFLVNCARGGVVDEAALLKALKEGWIAGAGLDVLSKDPPEADNPILSLDNVILSPHSAALTVEALALTATFAVEDLLRVLRGEKPLNPVNKSMLTLH